MSALQSSTLNTNCCPPERQKGPITETVSISSILLAIKGARRDSHELTSPLTDTAWK